jgi:multidrug efflux pump
VRITANPTALGAHGISLETLRTAISNANANMAKGTFDGPTKSWTIDANDQLGSAEDYAKLIVSWSNGAPIRLSDVAKVESSTENIRTASWMNRTPPSSSMSSASPAPMSSRRWTASRPTCRVWRRNCRPT